MEVLEDVVTLDMPHKCPFSEEPLGGLLMGKLQVSAPDRDLLRSREPHNLRSCLGWGRLYPRTD